MKSLDDIKKESFSGDSSSSSLQYPDFKKTGVGTFLYGIKEGLQQGAQAIGTGVNEFNKVFYGATKLDTLGGSESYDKDYERYAKNLADYNQRIQDKAIEKLGVDGANSFAAQAGAALGQAGGQLAVTAINPYLGVTAISAQAVGAGKSAYDEAYAGAKEQGMSDEQAKKIAKINGIVTGAVNLAEIIPVGRALSFGKEVIEKPFEIGLKGVAKRFGTNALLESGTEGAQDFVSSLTAKLTYDKEKNPLRDGIQSALASLPASLLFGGAGEANVQLKVNKATNQITTLLSETGMDPERAKVAANIIVHQQMLNGDENLFEKEPKELKDAYENAVEFKRAQLQKLATDPNYQMDQQLNDTADHIIGAYQRYDELANFEKATQMQMTDQEVQDTANYVMDQIPDDNLMNAEKEWQDVTEKEYRALQEKINKLQKKKERELKRARMRAEEKRAKDQFLNEPYVPEKDLPVIEMGNKPKQKSGLPTIQLESKKQPLNTDYTYEPIVQDIQDKIDTLLEKQDNLVTQFTEKHKKPVETKNEKPKQVTVVKKEVVQTTKSEKAPVEDTTNKQSNTTGLKTTGGGEFKPSGLATGTELRAIEKKVAVDGLESVSGSERAVLEDQMNLAEQYIKSNPEDALKVAMGEMNAPEGLLASVVFKAVENKALTEGDVDLIQRLATSDMTDQATAAGQFIKGFDTYNNEYSPTEIIKTINKNRFENVQKSLKDKTVKNAEKEAIKEVEDNVESNKPKKDDWDQFIESIRC